MLNGQEVAYELKKSRRAGNLRISVGCDANLAVTAPWFVPSGTAENFLRQKADWILSKLDYWQKRQPLIKLTGGGLDYKRNKTAARRLVVSEVARWNGFYHFSYRRISIRNQKTRWGSCSQKGNLNFNYKIIYLPKPLRDYLVVHELCHLRQPNHSKRFWDLVAETIPDHKERKKELKKIIF